MFFVLHTTYKTPKKKKTRYIQRIKHLKGEIPCYIHCMKHKKENFGVTYNVWSVEKEKKQASERRRKGKKRKNMLLSDSERANREKTRFWATQKGQMEKKTRFWVTQKEQKEKKHASEQLRKSKWRKNMLLSDSERANGEKTRFWATQKEQKAAKCHGWTLFFKAWGKNHEAGYHSLWSLVLIKRWYCLFITTFSLFFQQINTFLAGFSA